MKKFLLAILVLAICSGIAYGQSRGRVNKDNMVYKGESIFEDTVKMKTNQVWQNNSGATLTGTLSNGKPVLPKSNYYYKRFSATSFFSLTTDYNVYLLDLQGPGNATSSYNLLINGVASGFGALANGVSVFLPTGNEQLDGWTVRIQNATNDSGTTDIVLVPTCDSLYRTGVTDAIFAAASGITTPTNSNKVFLYNFADAANEGITLVYRWVSSGGTWYQVQLD